MLVVSTSFFMLCMASEIAGQQAVMAAIPEATEVEQNNNNDIIISSTADEQSQIELDTPEDIAMAEKAKEESIKKEVSTQEIDAQTIKVVDEASAKIAAASTVKVDRGNVDREKFLLKAATVDRNYIGIKLTLTAKDRDLLEHIVMGEAGDEDYAGKVIIAQAIRDAMITDSLTVKGVWRDFRYTKHIGRKPVDDVKKAVSYVFDVGGSAVQHRIMYFYAPRLVKSKFHESQTFVIEHGGHRVFDRNN